MHQGLGPAITCCVTLGRSPPFSGPQNTSLHNEGVGSLQGPFWPGEHRWAQVGVVGTVGTGHHCSTTPAHAAVFL